jgi:hypothetical protein
MLAGVKDLRAGRRGLLAKAEDFNDDVVFDHQPASGVEVIGGKDGEGIFQPDTDRGHGPAPLKVRSGLPAQ